jgi:hypothetical protein
LINAKASNQQNHVALDPLGPEDSEINPFKEPKPISLRFRDFKATFNSSS